MYQKCLRPKAARLLILGASVWLSACSPKGQAEGKSPTGAANEAKGGGSQAATNGEIQGSALVARVPEGTFGPRLLIRGDERMAIWAEPNSSRPGWYGLSIGPSGAPQAPVLLRDFTEGLSLFELLDLGGGQTLVTSVRATASGSAVETLWLTPDLSEGAVTHVIAETGAELLWAQAVRLKEGALVLWAERKDSFAELYAARVSPLGPQGAAVHVGSSLRAWQVASFGERILLATSEGKGQKAGIYARTLDFVSGQVGGEQRLLAGTIPAPDLDIAMTDTGSVVAYTEKGEFENRLMRVLLEKDGSVVSGALPVTPPRGDQTLVRLIADPKPGGRVRILFEELTGRSIDGREILLGTLDTHGRIEEPAIKLSTGMGDPLLPLVAFSREGPLFIAADAPGCEAPPCRSEVRATQLARSGAASMADVVSVPQLRGSSPAMIWDLRCTSAGCFALVAGPGPEAAVYLKEITPPTGPSPQVTFLTDSGAPRVTSFQTVAEIPELSALTAAAVGSEALLAWVSFFDPGLPYETPKAPAPDGRLAPTRALLKTQILTQASTDRELADFGQLRISSEQAISYRARSLGGISMSEPHEGKRLLGWAALDGKDPQVFLTLIDERGKKLQQKMFTKTPSEVTDVTVLRVAGGYVVAWVDGSEKGTEVVVARADEQLAQLGDERVVSRGSEGPTGLSLAQVGGKILLTFSDARGSRHPGYADVFAASLDEETLELSGPPRRLFQSDPHSHSARLVRRTEGKADTALLLWAESTPSIAGVLPGGLSVAEIDAEGRIVSPPTTVALPGDVKGFAARCQETICRVLATLDTGDAGELWAAELIDGSSGRAVKLNNLSERPMQLSPPVFAGDRVFLVDARDGKFFLVGAEVKWN